MVNPRTLSLVLCLAVAAVVGTAACHDSNDITSANKSLVNLNLDAPSTAKSGQNFGVQIRATNVGIAGVKSGHITVTLPAPLTVVSVSAPSGTSATFSNGASGGTVDWNLGTLDANSQSKLDITAMGVLANNEGTKKLTIVAMMTAQGISPGESTVQGDVTLVQ